MYLYTGRKKGRNYPNILKVIIFRLWDYEDILLY